jgi:two-component system sensor histidine kinase KdpD
MSHRRPDPDQLLSRVRESEQSRERGRLKVFFGAAPGVGKTYAMLEAAREQRVKGLDVIVGVVETHGRAETEALLEGLEVQPRRELSYRGRSFSELDLDAALERCPALILVDELAHSNVPGSRHVKRLGDVEELLAAGVDVYTTLNVQHVESLNDVVAQITGITVRETVPDAVLDTAHEIELVDLPVEDLLRRLADGKVYVPFEAERAAANFFQTGNLIALRQLAMRRAAQRIDAQMLRYRTDEAVVTTWPTTQRLLVGIAPSPYAARLIRTARQMADRMRCEWLAVFVETPTTLRLPPADRDQLERTIRLAEQLGAETVTVSGVDAADEVVLYARRRNVTHIVVGKPLGRGWRDLVRGSFVDRVIRSATGIDVVVVSGVADEPPAGPRPPARHRRRARGYVVALMLTTLTTALAALLERHLEAPNLVMLYLLAVLLVTLRAGRGPGILASLLSVAEFDFFFVPPPYTLAVADTQYLVTFAVMLAAALVISDLTSRLYDQAEAARTGERRMAALHAVSQVCAEAADSAELVRTASLAIAEAVGARIAGFLPRQDGRLAVVSEPSCGFFPDEQEFSVATWAFAHREAGGLGTSTLPGARALYLPMLTPRAAMGVLAAQPSREHPTLGTEHVHLLQTFASQLALAVERANLVAEAQRAALDAQTERTRSLILSSISHDIRTPLATISGAAETLALRGDRLPQEERGDLARSIHEGAERLGRFVSNLLDLARLTTGAVALRREAQPIEEIVGAAINQLDRALAGRHVRVTLPPDLAMVAVDAVLLTQVLANLLENAAAYSPANSTIEISARQGNGEVEVSVADHGCGLPPGEEERIFDEFYRPAASAARPGAGLGLAICRAIVEAHGGRIHARNVQGGGCRIAFTVPCGIAPGEGESEEEG